MCPRLSADCLDTLPQTAPTRGIWWWPTTTTKKQEESTIASRWSLSFSSAPRVVCPCPGTRRRVARQLSGWGSNCCTALTTLASHSDEQNGSRSGPEKWLRSGQGSRKGWVASCASWGHLKLKDPSSDPSIDSCHSIPGPQYAKFRGTSDSFSGLADSSRHYNCAVSTEGTTVAPSRDVTASSMSEGRDGFHSNSRRKTGPGSEENPLLSFHFAVLVTLKLLYGRDPPPPAEAHESSDSPRARSRWLIKFHSEVLIGTGYVHEENEPADCLLANGNEDLDPLLSFHLDAVLVTLKPVLYGARPLPNREEREEAEARGTRVQTVPVTSFIRQQDNPATLRPLRIGPFALSLLLLPYPSFPSCASSVQTGSYTDEQEFFCSVEFFSVQDQNH